MTDEPSHEFSATQHLFKPEALANVQFGQILVRNHMLSSHHDLFWKSVIYYLVISFC